MSPSPVSTLALLLGAAAALAAAPVAALAALAALMGADDWFASQQCEPRCGFAAGWYPLYFVVAAAATVVAAALVAVAVAGLHRGLRVAPGQVRLLATGVAAAVGAAASVLVAVALAATPGVYGTAALYLVSGVTAVAAGLGLGGVAVPSLRRLERVASFPVSTRGSGAG